VFHRRLDQFEVTPVRGTEAAVSCTFSPDGLELLVIMSDSSLRRVRLSDGLVETLAPQTDFSAAWLDDARVVFSNGGRLWMSGTTPGAPPTPLTEDQARSMGVFQPMAVPGANALLFVSAQLPVASS
jgi:hypothetical protein